MGMGDFDLYSFRMQFRRRGGRVSWVRGAVGGFGEQPPKNQSMEAGCDLSGARDLINDPAQAIDKLIGRVQALYRNYLSTNALHWYFQRSMRIVVNACWKQGRRSI